MTNVLTILAMIPLTFTYAQTSGDEIVYSTIIDALVKCRSFEFYNYKLQQIETQEYSEHPFDSIIVFSPETFEEVAKSALDILIEADSTNLQEARLFKQRVNFPNGLFLISKIDASQLHKHILLQDYIELESYPKVRDLTELSSDILKKATIGTYSTMTSTRENTSIYKYAIKAYLAFSGVLWDKTKKYCVVECGYHYRLSEEHPDSGPSGGGFQIVMQNENGKPRIIRFICLWDE